MSVTAVERPAHLDKPWTAHEVLRGLFFHLVQQGFAPLTEVSTPPGLGLLPSTFSPTRRRTIDMLAIRPAIDPPDRLVLVAIEVKVTHRDFLADVRNPEKQQPWRELAHQHCYAAPAGLIDPDEIPDGSGLLTARRLPHFPDAPAHFSWAKAAPVNYACPPTPTWLLHAIATRAAWAEAYRKGLNP